MDLLLRFKRGEELGVLAISSSWVENNRVINPGNEGEEAINDRALSLAD